MKQFSGFETNGEVPVQAHPLKYLVTHTPVAYASGSHSKSGPAVTAKYPPQLACFVRDIFFGRRQGLGKRVPAETH